MYKRQLQYQLIQDLVASGVDAICVVPVDPASLEPVLKPVSYTHLKGAQPNCRVLMASRV